MSLGVVSESGHLFGWGVVGAVTLELFGLPLQPIVFALMGGIFGQPLTKQDERWWRRFSIYMAAALLSALAGVTVAEHVGWSARTANLLSAGCSIFFQVILAKIAERVPAGLDWVFNVFGRRGQ